MSFFKSNHPYIIAEIASAHEGSPDLAIELEDKTLSNCLNDRTFTQKLHLRQNEIDEKLKKKLDLLYIIKKKRVTNLKKF